MRRSRGGTRKVVPMMASTSRLPKRRQRSSNTSSPENHCGGGGRAKMDEKDLEFSAPNKRMRSIMSLQVCATTEEGQESNRTDRGGEGEFVVERGEVTRELVAKSTNEILNRIEHCLRPRQMMVSKLSTSVIGARVPKKARSGCVKRSLQEYSASDGHNHQQHSNSGASESGNRTEESKSLIGKGSKLSSSVKEDIEMDVAEVLLSLMKQSHRPEYAKDSQQKSGVSHVEEQIKGDFKPRSGKNEFELVDKFGGSELKLLENHTVPARENAKISTEDDGLVEESKKEGSLFSTSYSLAIESRNSIDAKMIPMAPMAEYQRGKLDISFVKTMDTTKKHMAEVTVGKQENFMTEMRNVAAPIHSTSLEPGQLNLRLEATKNAQNTLSSSFPVREGLCPTSCSMGRMQSRETTAFMEKSSGIFAAAQDLQLGKLSQDGRKRCATHYYIAQSIMCRLQCNKTNLLASTAGSAYSSVNGSVQKDVNEREPQCLILDGNTASKLSTVTNSACPRDKEVANETFSLPDSSQKKQHPNHKGPQVSSSEKKICQMVGSKLFNGEATTCSTFSVMNSHQVTSEGSPFMTTIPSNDYAFPISTNTGNSATFRGRVHGHVMPYFNGAVYPPEMCYSPQFIGQQSPHPQTQVLPSGQSNTGFTPHPQTQVLPSGQSNTGFTHSSSNKRPHQAQQQQHVPNVGGHNFLLPTTGHSQYLQKQFFQSFRQSHKPEVTIPYKKQLVDNPICCNQRTAHNQHCQAPLPQMQSTMGPMVGRNSNVRMFEKQELVEGPKVGFELPASQAVGISYTPFGGRRITEKSLSLSEQKFPLLPSDVAKQRYFAPLTADVVNKNYQVGGKAGIDFTGADGARKDFTGNPSSCLSQFPAMSKAIPNDWTGMVNGCSIFDNSAKTHSFYTASETESGDSQSHYGIQRHHAQGTWNKTSMTNGQPLSVVSTNAAYNPVMMSHPAHWNSSARSSFPQHASSSTLPAFSYNPPHQLVSGAGTSGGNNNIVVAAHGNGMSVMQAPLTLANGSHSPPPKSYQSSSKERESGSVALPNGTCSNSTSQQNLASPICRMAVPSLLSTCPSQVPEVKN